MKKLFLPLILLLLGFALPAAAQEKIKIVATTSQIGDLVQNIVGDSADVVFLMGTGIDPHLYQPTRSDISKLNQADVIFYNGLNLEGKMEDLFERLSASKKTFSVGDHLFKESLKVLDNEKGFDPHIWMDVQNWVRASDQIVSYLSELYPKNKDIYERHKDEYVGYLIGLHEHAQASMNSIAPSKKVLITAHDAFGYFGAAYGIEVIGIQGISTESEAGLKRIENTVSLIVDRNIPAIFIESSVGDHNIRAIVEGARARGHNVIIGGILYSDAMGDPGTAEGTYIGMIKHNVKTIAEALGGSAYHDSDTPPDFREPIYGDTP